MAVAHASGTTFREWPEHELHHWTSRDRSHERDYYNWTRRLPHIPIPPLRDDYAAAGVSR